MDNAQRTEKMLRDLFSHHSAHEIESGDSTPFIDIYVNDDMVLQFSCGALNFSFNDNTDDANVFLSEQEKLTYDEAPEVWSFSGPWTGEETFTLCVGTLNQLGHDIEDVTYAIEQSCPSNGSIAWDEIGTESNLKQGDVVENPREKLQAVYEHLRGLEEDADGVPNPFPLVYFYVDGKMLGYNFGPGVHSLEQHSDEERRQFDEFVNEHPDLEATAAEKSSISVSHYRWTPDSALDITERVLDLLYTISIDQITYAKIVTGAPESNISWIDIDN